MICGYRVYFYRGSNENACIGGYFDNKDAEKMKKQLEDEGLSVLIRKIEVLK
ncbi:MAG: hypothetical protein FWF07_01260 [Methanomassiliicoccaceae archaeon]|nr:hypothetical protein [Methanomassiliicoccaceae archaeon]